MLFAVIAVQLALAVGLSIGGVKTAQAETRFSDVPPGAWYERAVMQARTRGMVDGFPDGTYRPEKALTYAEYLSMLAKLVSIEPEKPAPGDHWAAGTIRALQNAGILDGATWRPEWIQAPIPREKALVYALRALGIPPRDASFDFFVDSDRLSDVDRGYVNTAYLESLTDGIGRDAATGERRFGAGETLTRAQAAVLLNQLFDYRADAQAYRQKKAAERAKEKIPGNDPNKTVWNAVRAVKIGGKTITAQIVYVNPKSPRVKIKTALGGGVVGGTEDLAALARRHGAVAAINGTFFNAYSDKQPQGNLEIKGKFVHLSNVGSTVGFGKDGTVRFSTLRTFVDGMLRDSFEWPDNWYAWGINHLRDEPAAITLFTPEKGTKTGKATGHSVIVRRGIVQAIVTGEAAIPPDGFVVHIGPDPTNRDILSRFEVGVSAGYRLRHEDPAKRPIDWSMIDDAVGAGPRLVMHGRIVVDPRREGFTDPKILTLGGARSAIGTTKEGYVMLVTVPGATIPELAQVMKALGAVQAMNLDGGASSGLYYRGRYLTAPGRAISNAILVFEDR
ncbi:phosphodiester glycosidase family protein [Hydrogenibacillus sp. N12]|uniref:phosphodiester glycosidase family protein n=1 Tax=Hydrogenibacillus sp. N12 TaxID=2866627 RepID=UPI00207BE510|nr:phosphodiester glycosidase family protein [Hydrogenibacillus sp. N12]